MWDVQLFDCREGPLEGGVHLRAAVRGSQIAAQLPQRSEDAGTVETLSLTVFAETHALIMDLAGGTGDQGSGISDQG
jgi:hypothetical protein